MNAAAQNHLSKAKEYLAKGDEFYRKAKPEIEAAIAAGASQREVARFLARGRTWVQDVIAWDGEGTLYGKDTERRQRDMAKQVLREASASEIDQMLEDVPAEKRAAIATGLISSSEVREQIRVATPLAREQHLDLAAEIFADSDKRSKDRIHKESGLVRDIDASRLISDAAKLLADANAILFKHAVADDLLPRCDAAMERVEQKVKHYHEIRETAPAV